VCILCVPAIPFLRRNLLADFPAFSAFNRNGLDVALTCYSAAGLPSDLREAVFDLTKANMHDVYVEAGWGWKVGGGPGWQSLLCRGRGGWGVGRSCRCAVMFVGILIVGYKPHIHE
jgi:hypothetical protein